MLYYGKINEDLKILDEALNQEHLLIVTYEL